MSEIGAIGYPGVGSIIKLTSSLAYCWHTYHYGTDTTKSSSFVDVVFDSTQAYALGNFNWLSSGYQSNSYTLCQILKTYGTINWQVSTSLTNTLATVTFGRLAITSDKTIIFATTWLDSLQPLILMYSGANYGTVLAKYLSVSATYPSSYMTADTDSSNNLCTVYQIYDGYQFIKLPPTMTSVTSSQYWKLGDTTDANMFVMSASTPSSIYFAMSKNGYMGSPTRGLIFKMGLNTFDFTLTNCAASAGAILYGWSLTSLSTTVTSAIANNPAGLHYGYKSGGSVATITGSLVAQQYLAVVPWVQRNTGYSQKCLLPASQEPIIFTYTISTDSPSKTFTPPTLLSCDGRGTLTPVLTTFAFANGTTTDPTGVFAVSGGAIVVTLSSTDYDFIQNFDIIIPYRYDYTTINKYARVVIRPAVTYSYSTPTSLSARACPMNIYPFVSGQTSQKQLNHAILDDFDNHILCGIQSVDWTARSIAFVQYMDQSFVEYWQYSFFDTISGNANSDCRYLAVQGAYIYAGMIITSSSSSLYAPIIAKLNRNDGTIVYLRRLPEDGFGNTLLQSITGIMPSASSNKLLIMYIYRNVISGTTYYSPSGIRFDESTFILDYHKVYYNIGSFTTSALYFQHFFKSEADSAFYGFLQSPAGEYPWTFKVDLSTGNTICKQKSPYSSSTSNYQGQVLDFSSTEFLSFSRIEGSGSTQYLQISLHSKSTCAFTIDPRIIKMTSAITLQGVTAAVDSSSNIIVSASYNQLLILKLDSGLNVLSKQMMNTGFYQLAPINTQMTTSGNFMFYYSGKLTSTDLMASFIFMADPSLNFGTYGCFNILSYPQPSDSTFISSFSFPGVAAISMTGSPPANGLTITPPLSISPIEESFGIVGRSFNWAQKKQNRLKHQQLDGFSTIKYQQNPFNLLKCSSISGYTTYSDPSVFEFLQNTGVKTITFTQPLLNCQLRPIIIQFLGGVLYTTTNNPQYVSFFPATNSITVDTTLCFTSSGTLCPRTNFINVRYFDANEPLQGSYYQAVQLRIIAGNTTLSNSNNLDQCMFHPMPFVYGGNTQDSFTYTIGVHPTDGNIVLGGGSYNFTGLGDGQDGFAMRLSTTGIIEWMNYFNTLQGAALEIITTIEISPAQSAVYGTFARLSGNFIYSILKLSYNEGKIIWSKTVHFNQNRADGVFAFLAVPFILLNPITQTDFLIASQYANSYVLPVFTYLSDNGLNLIVNYQIQVERLGTTTSNQAGEPIYHPSLNFYYISGVFGTNPFIYKVATATGAYLYGLQITQSKNLLGLTYLVYNSFNSKLYMAFAVASAAYRVNLYAIDDATQTISASKNLDPWVNKQGLHLSTDDTNGNILMICLEIGLSLITILLDQNLNILSNLYWYPVYGNGLYKLGYQLGRDIYFAFSSPWLYNNGNSQIFVGRISLEHNYQKYMSRWATPLGWASANLADTLSTLSSSTLTIQTGLLTSECSEVQEFFIQNYVDVYYPQNEQYAGHVYVPPFGNVNKVLNPPTQVDLPVLECIKGQVCSKTILPSSLKNCQGMGSVSYTITSVRQTTLPSFITVSGNTLTIDATNSNAYPGFSQLHVAAIIAGFPSLTSTVIQTVQIFPVGFVPASQTQTPPLDPACAPQTQWPKIFFSNWENLLGLCFDLDQNSGNYLIGGSSYSLKTLIYNNYNDGYNNAFNMLTDNNGQRMWGYTIYSNTPAAQNLMTTNIIFGSDNYIYSLIRTQQYQFVSLLKQNYTHGTYIWMKQMNTSISTYGSTNFFIDSALYQDPTTNYIYLTYNHNGIINMNPIFKIDPTLNPPVQLYYNFFYYPTYCCGTSLYELKIHYSAGTGYLFAYGYTAALGYSAKPTLIKYNSVTGQMTLAKYFNANANYQSSVIRKIGMDIDSTGNIYASYYFDYSAGDSFYFYQLDQNLNILQSRGSQVTIDTGQYLGDVCLDEANNKFFSMFSFGETFILYTLSTIDFTVKSLYYYMMYNSNRQNYVMEMKFYSNDLYYAAQGSNFITSYFQLYLNKVSGSMDFSDTSDGFTLYYQKASLIAPPNVDGTNLLLFSVYETNFVLQVVRNIYAELFTSTNPVKVWQFEQPTYVQSGGVTLNDIYFPTPLAPQQAIVSGGVVTYDIDHATSCKGYTFNIALSVDLFSSVPAFLTSSTGATALTVSIDPGTTNSFVGLYTVRVRYSNQLNSGQYIEDTFELEIYPAANYGITTLNTCTNVLWPFISGQTNPINYQITYVDVDLAGQNLIMCGYSVGSTLGTQGSVSGIIIEKNMNFQTHFMYAVTLGPYLNGVRRCLYADYQNFTALALGGSTSSYQDLHTIYKFKSITGQFIQGKSFQKIGNNFAVYSMVYANATGDSYIGGQAISTSYLRYSSSTANALGFLLKIDINFNFVWYSTMEYTPNGYGFVIQNISPDDLNQKFVYGAVAAKADYACSACEDQNGYISFDMKSGTTLAYWRFKRSVSYSVVYQSQIPLVYAMDNSGCYMASYFYENWFNYELILTKFGVYTSPGSGDPIIQKQIVHPSNSLINVDMQQASNSKIVVVTTSNYYVNFFRLSSTLLIETTAQIRFYHSYFPYPLTLTLTKDGNGMFYAFVFQSSSSYQTTTLGFKFDGTSPTMTVPSRCGTYITTYTNDPMESNPSGPSTISNWISQSFSTNMQVSSTYGNVLLTNIRGSFIKYYDNSTAPDQLGYLGTNISGCSSVDLPLAPQQQNGTFPVTSAIGSLQVVMPTQCQAFSFYTWAELSTTQPLPSFITYDNTTGYFSVDVSQNSYVGNYSIFLHFKTYYYNPWYNTTTLWINIVPNHPPYMAPGYTVSNTIFANHNFSESFKMLYDEELDLPTFTAIIYSSTTGLALSPQPTWFLTDATSVADTIIVSAQAPDNSFVGNYYIKVIISDSFNPTPTNNTFVNLTISPNLAPQLASYNGAMNTTIPWPFNYSLDTSIFVDLEGDSVLIDCTYATTATANDATWISMTYSEALHNLTFSGQMPRSNTYQGTYTISCNLHDQYDAPPNVLTFTLTVNPKQQTSLIYTIPGQYTRVPNNLNVSYSGMYADKEGQAIALSLTINGTAYGPSFNSWFIWNQTGEQFQVTPKCNCDGGNHTISLTMDDGISVPTTTSFNLEIMENWPLIQNMSVDIQNIGLVVMNTKCVYYNVSELFQNPEAEPYTMFYALQGELPLKSFMKDWFNGTFTVASTSNDDLGTHNVEIVGVDDAGWYTVIPFLVIVKPCYYKCTLCWDSNYNTCVQCADNYFLLYSSECVEKCVDGTFPLLDSQNHGLCADCPIECATCFGKNSSTQCYTCAKGYYLLGNGCYSNCPMGYWNNILGYICSRCNSACSDCFGPSYTQCRNCTEVYGFNGLGIYTKTGYLLSGTTCQYPKCVKNQFFRWSTSLTNGIPTGICIDCFQNCSTCAESLSNQCTTCLIGLVLTNNTCIPCEMLPNGGFFTNDQKACQDICGDGLLRGQNECDDNNTIDGDGCSSKCKLEMGYVCNQNGSVTCKYILRPTFKIMSVDSSNIITLKFSSNVNIMTNTSISAANMVVNVTGLAAPSTFTWRFLAEQPQPLTSIKNISTFRIILENFEESVEGGGQEKVTVSFINYSEIVDFKFKNALTETPAIDSLSPYAYISPSAASAIAGGGETLKYTLMTVFSFQLLMKLVLSSSMSYLWSFIHALQILSILLYLNIDFPDNVVSFINYLQFANGNIPQLSAYIPDASDYLIDKTEIELDYLYSSLPPKFNDMGVEIFLAVSYGKSISIQAAAIFIGIPILFALNQMCSKVTLWDDLLSSFFFNGPLRALVTMYLDLTFQIVVNTQFLSFGNYSAIVASVVCLVVGYLVVYLPFAFMSLIYQNRRSMTKAEWAEQYGMLTEDISTKDITQLYFYPTFMYQRLIIAIVIVYLQPYPAIQCFTVLVCNVAMLFYLIYTRPFKLENQQTLTVVNEIAIFIVVCLYLIFIYKDLSVDQKIMLGWVVVALIIFQALGNFAVVFYFGAQKLRKKVREMFGDDDHELDSPNSSDVSVGSYSSSEDETERLKAQGLRSDEQLIDEIRRDKQKKQMKIHVEDVEEEKEGPYSQPFTDFASNYPNPFPTMICKEPYYLAKPQFTGSNIRSENSMGVDKPNDIFNMPGTLNN